MGETWSGRILLQGLVRITPLLAGLVRRQLGLEVEG